MPSIWVVVEARGGIPLTIVTKNARTSAFRSCQRERLGRAMSNVDGSGMKLSGAPIRKCAGVSAFKSVGSSRSG